MTVYDDNYKASDLAKGKMNEVFSAAQFGPLIIEHKSFNQYEMANRIFLDGMVWVLVNLCGGEAVLWHDKDHNSFGWVNPDSFLYENKEESGLAISIRDDRRSQNPINKHILDEINNIKGPLFASRLEAMDAMMCVLADLDLPTSRLHS